MSVELACKKPSEDTERRMVRVITDVLALAQLSKAEIRGVYKEIEITRDALSRLLDRADGKHA